MPVRYEVNAKLTGGDLKGIFEASGLRRPTGEGERLDRMGRNAGVTVTAFEGERLVGIVRAVTDFAYCAYISDVGVRSEYQRRGVGREMVRRLREHQCEEVQLLLLENPDARGHYAKLGFERADNAWKVPRSR